MADPTLRELIEMALAKAEATGTPIEIPERPPGVEPLDHVRDAFLMSMARLKATDRPVPLIAIETPAWQQRSRIQQASLIQQQVTRTAAAVSALNATDGAVRPPAAPATSKPMPFNALRRQVQPNGMFTLGDR